MASSQLPRVHTHAVLALCALAVIGAYALRPSFWHSQVARAPEEIIVEHAESIMLHITRSRGTRSLIQFAHSGTQPFTLTLPVSWDVREVTAMPLDASLAPRWTIAPGATISFWIADGGSLTVRNQSEATLLIDAVDIDANGKTERRSVLVKEGAVSLW